MDISRGNSPYEFCFCCFQALTDAGSVTALFSLVDRRGHCDPGSDYFLLSSTPLSQYILCQSVREGCLPQACHTDWCDAGSTLVSVHISVMTPTLKGATSRYSLLLPVLFYCIVPIFIAQSRKALSPYALSNPPWIRSPLNLINVLGERGLNSPIKRCIHTHKCICFHQEALWEQQQWME